MRKCRLGVSLYHVYGQPISDVGHETACFEYDEDNRILADAYLAEHASRPPKFACDHCGAFFRVEVVGIHHPKRGVIMCPFCGNEPKKVEEK